MPKVHYNPENSPYPQCGVYRDQTRVSTTKLDEVTCKSCLYWIGYSTNNQALLEKARSL